LRRERREEREGEESVQIINNCPATL